MTNKNENLVLWDTEVTKQGQYLRLSFHNTNLGNIWNLEQRIESTIRKIGNRWV